MSSELPQQYRVAADQLDRLATLVEGTGFSASDIAKILNFHARVSPVEHPSEIRLGVQEMEEGEIETVDFAQRLRRQAELLRSQADTIAPPSQ